MAYGPILLAYTADQCQSLIRAAEDSGETFKRGVPVKLDAQGMVAVVDSTWSAADVIYGISAEAAHNLTTDNTEEGGYNEATPPNQTGRTIPAGAWMRDGKIGVYKADNQNVFIGSVKSDQTMAQSYILSATVYGLTYDSSSGYWYVDLTDTSGNNACVILDGVVPGDTSKVYFHFESAQRYWD